MLRRAVFRIPRREPDDRSAQSSLFPRYDRNPQTCVDNIFNAKPTHYKQAI
jgi:hypothetical protein